MTPYFALTSLVLPLLASGQEYPRVSLYEWTAVPRNDPSATTGWEMTGNFYVVTDYETALPKLGVTTGISPSDDYAWATS